MPLGDLIAADLPYLRRHARALTGSQEAGDDLVRAMLEAATDDEALRASLGGGRIALFRAFNRFWHPAAPHRQSGRPVDMREAAANQRLQRITPASRQALLLTAVEQFTPAEAGEIMGLSAREVSLLADEAIATIERDAATRVLIIEDEPLIAMQLEELVRSLGHSLGATVATRAQALAEARRAMPGLVLADIQLADGSSGLDAVDDILALGEVPVVFITAYPERLLTGCQREPAYLVTKPFTEAAVRATIGQALFFRSGQSVA